MRTSSLIAILGLASQAFAATCYKSFSKTDFPNCAQLDSMFAVHWAINGGTITFGLHADAKDGNWFAFGLSENGGMKGADIVALIKSNGVWQASDRFATQFAMPVPDLQQDWNLVSPPKFADGSMSTIVSRKMKTCDPNDQEIIAGYNHPVIWAIGSGVNFSRHIFRNRGNYNIIFKKTDAQLADQAVLDSADRSSYKTFDMAVKNLKMPTKLTSYFCMNFEFPSDKKYHAVEYESLVTNKYVHHIQINQCTSKPSRPLNQPFDCGSGSNMEPNCQTMIIIWGPGVGKVSYPSAAGLPIGQGVTQYGWMQIHYNNPTGIDNFLDSSGIRLTYTPNLRKNDIGIMSLGPFSLNLPPGQSNVEVPGSACKYSSGPDLTLLNNEFHMHARGKKMITRKYRGKQELMPIGERNYYDYNFQGESLIDSQASVLKAGDVLVTHCTFDTTSVNYTVNWGEGSDMEMCFNFVQYYPRVANNPGICDFFGSSIPTGVTPWKEPTCVPS